MPAAIEMRHELDESVRFKLCAKYLLSYESSALKDCALLFSVLTRITICPSGGQS
jgi:hypothetical protein